MRKIEPQEVRSFYEELHSIWPDEDRWHSYTRSSIISYLQKQIFTDDCLILNAGSGGSNYGLKKIMIHADLAKKNLVHLNNSVVASVERLPFKKAVFTDIICVGSVINYCDALVVINEAHRVLRPSGRLIVEFESSWGYEHWRSGVYKKDAYIVELSYAKKTSKQWVYSPSYITSLIKSVGFRITGSWGFHCLSGLLYNFCKKDNFSAKIAKLDPVCRHIPIIKNHFANIIFNCTKL